MIPQAPTGLPHPLRQIFILSIVPAIGVGFCRFAYALVLPDMRDSLHWSYAMAGFMNTANSAGYFVGALCGALIARRLGLFRSVMTGALMCVASLIICALSGNFFSLIFGRILGGLGAGVAFVSSASIAATIAQNHPGRSNLFMGLFNAGPGTGLILSGMTAPFMLQAYGPGSWWIVWSAFALVSLVMTSLLLLAPRDTNPARHAEIATSVPLKPMIFFVMSYFMFGAGYIAYMTFMLAYVRDAGADAVTQSMFWCLIGIGAFLSPWLWRSLMARGHSGRTMAILLSILIVATLLARFGQSPGWLAASAFLFGGASIGAGTSALTFARLNHPPAGWPRAIGIVTIGFSIGQTLGPSLTGLITDAVGTLSSALDVSITALAIGVVFAILQKPLVPSATAADKAA